MATYDSDMLDSAQLLLERTPGQKGKLHGARVRRSISTSYYALFHFLTDEIGLRLVGSTNRQRWRRRIFGRTLTHSGIKKALDKVKGDAISADVVEFLSGSGNSRNAVTPPSFARTMAKTFAAAQAIRHYADYDLNKQFSVADAKMTQLRVKRAIDKWRSASLPAEKEFKNALCLLIVLKGQLRPDG